MERGGKLQTEVLRSVVFSRLFALVQDRRPQVAVAFWLGWSYRSKTLRILDVRLETLSRHLAVPASHRHDDAMLVADFPRWLIHPRRSPSAPVSPPVLPTYLKLTLLSSTPTYPSPRHVRRSLSPPFFIQHSTFRHSRRPPSCPPSTLLPLPPSHPYIPSLARSADYRLVVHGRRAMQIEFSISRRVLKRRVPCKL